MTATDMLEAGDRVIVTIHTATGPREYRGKVECAYSSSVLVRISRIWAAWYSRGIIRRDV